MLVVLSVDDVLVSELLRCLFEAAEAIQDNESVLLKVLSVSILLSLPLKTAIGNGFGSVYLDELWEGKGMLFGISFSGVGGCLRGISASLTTCVLFIFISCWWFRFSNDLHNPNKGNFKRNYFKL